MLTHRLKGVEISLSQSVVNFQGIMVYPCPPDRCRFDWKIAERRQFVFSLSSWWMGNMTKKPMLQSLLCPLSHRRRVTPGVIMFRDCRLWDCSWVMLGRWSRAIWGTSLLFWGCWFLLFSASLLFLFPLLLFCFSAPLLCFSTCFFLFWLSAFCLFAGCFLSSCFSMCLYVLVMPIWVFLCFLCFSACRF